RSKRNGTVAGEMMPSRDDDQHRFVNEQFQPKPFAIPERRPDKCDVDFAALQTCDQARRVALLGREHDAGKTLPIGANDAGYPAPLQVVESVGSREAASSRADWRRA